MRVRVGFAGVAHTAGDGVLRLRRGRGESDDALFELRLQLVDPAGIVLLAQPHSFREVVHALLLLLEDGPPLLRPLPRRLGLRVHALVPVLLVRDERVRAILKEGQVQERGCERSERSAHGQERAPEPCWRR